MTTTNKTKWHHLLEDYRPADVSYDNFIAEVIKLVPASDWCWIEQRLGSLYYKFIEENLPCMRFVKDEVIDKSAAILARQFVRFCNPTSLSFDAMQEELIKKGCSYNQPEMNNMLVHMYLQHQYRLGPALFVKNQDFCNSFLTRAIHENHPMACIIQARYLYLEMMENDSTTSIEKIAVNYHHLPCPLREEHRYHPNYQSIWELIDIALQHNYLCEFIERRLRYDPRPFGCRFYSETAIGNILADLDEMRDEALADLLMVQSEQQEEQQQVVAGESLLAATIASTTATTTSLKGHDDPMPTKGGDELLFHDTRPAADDGDDVRVVANTMVDRNIKAQINRHNQRICQSLIWQIEERHCGLGDINDIHALKQMEQYSAKQWMEKGDSFFDKQQYNKAARAFQHAITRLYGTSLVSGKSFVRENFPDKKLLITKVTKNAEGKRSSSLSSTSGIMSKSYAPYTMLANAQYKQIQCFEKLAFGEQSYTFLIHLIRTCDSSLHMANVDFFHEEAKEVVRFKQKQ